MAEFLSREWCHSIRGALWQRVRHASAYEGCSIDPRWDDCQAFYAWLKANAVEGWALDKDLLVPGNTVYGPDTCIYVPRQLNNTFKRPYRKASDTPANVHPWPNGKWRVCLVVQGKTRSHGIYESLETAALVAERESLRYKYSVAMSYRNDPRLTALIDVLVERLKNQANTLRPKLVAANLL